MIKRLAFVSSIFFLGLLSAQIITAQNDEVYLPIVSSATPGTLLTYQIITDTNPIVIPVGQALFQQHQKITILYSLAPDFGQERDFYLKLSPGGFYDYQDVVNDDQFLLGTMPKVTTIQPGLRGQIMGQVELIITSPNNILIINNTIGTGLEWDPPNKLVDITQTTGQYLSTIPADQITISTNTAAMSGQIWIYTD